MASQPQLFSEDINDALRDVIRVLGGNKTVAARLRPELAADAAGAWLKDCLNPARRERLYPDQVVWLLREGRKAGCHSAMNFICDEAGYARPSPLEPEDEEAQLKREFVQAVDWLKNLNNRAERKGVRLVA